MTDKASQTPRWRVKDEQGDDLIAVWRSRPRGSDEYAAAEIIEQLEQQRDEARKLSDASLMKEAAALEQLEWDRRHGEGNAAGQMPPRAGTHSSEDLVSAPAAPSSQTPRADSFLPIPENTPYMVLREEYRKLEEGKRDAALETRSAIDRVCNDILTGRIPSKSVEFMRNVAQIGWSITANTGPTREILDWAISLLEIYEGVKVNPNSQEWLARLREMRNMLAGIPASGGPKGSDLPSAPQVSTVKLWGTGWLHGGNYKERGKVLQDIGKIYGEPWYEAEDGTHWSSFDIRYRADETATPVSSHVAPQAGRTEAPNAHAATSRRKEAISDTEPAGAAPTSTRQSAIRAAWQLVLSHLPAEPEDVESEQHAQWLTLDDAVRVLWTPLFAQSATLPADAKETTMSKEIKALHAALKQAVQLASVAVDWNLNEFEIDGVMVPTVALWRAWGELLDSSTTPPADAEVDAAIDAAMDGGDAQK